MNNLKTINHINRQEYNWSDDLGFHQYYCNGNDKPTQMENISIFEEQHPDKLYRIYSWNDNLGSHQYYVDMMEI